MNPKITQYLRPVGIVAGATLLVSIIVVVVGLFLHWKEPAEFSNGFFVAGAIMVILGFLTVTGGMKQRGDAALLYGESAGHSSMSEHAQQRISDFNERYGTLIFFSSVGALLIGIAILIS